MKLACLAEQLSQIDAKNCIPLNVSYDYFPTRLQLCNLHSETILISSSV